MDEDVDSSMDSEQPPPERKEGNNKCFHLYNCDRTYNLEVVGKLINDIKATSKDKLGLDITISTEKYFRLFEMSQLCETIQSGPPMDFAIFVVHANESRLSINEENAGIGYARFYKALLQAAGEYRLDSVNQEILNVVKRAMYRLDFNTKVKRTGVLYIWKKIKELHLGY